MDEFFDFDNAARSLDLETSPFDIERSFADPMLNEDSFAGIQQHFSSMDEEQHWLDLQSAMADDKSNDFADFPRWIDGMIVPNQSCAYCRRMRFHCKILKEGLRKGSCTSCVALARSCSLTHPADPELNAPLENACDSNFGVAGNAVHEYVRCSSSTDPKVAACISCRLGGLRCSVPQNNGHSASCSNCISSTIPCSLADNDTTMDGVSFGVDTASLDLTPSRSNSDSNLMSLSSSDNVPSTLESSTKTGPRFSKESLRVLRGWLLTHSSHPYPTDDEKESLRRQTGLNKTQIVNWLANARRRGKARAPRSTSPSVRSNYVNAMDIPRRSTPALQHMNPLERWKNSPPEHEAASVTAIAKAVTSSTFGPESPRSRSSHAHSDESRSLWNVSSTSSLGTSDTSGRSFASAFSHKSQGSFGSFGSAANQGRRRRRKAAPKPVKVASFTALPRAYQCTFCTETFKTKHDWQRHEKSLHLSLERWVCCPDGPLQPNTENGAPQCVFCGEASPSADHVETHNYSGCADKGLEERTFYRKDHLRQHLHLVHEVKFQAHSMEQWIVATPEIRSRCGFCGLLLGSWSIRVDHLAEHFKSGDSMANWKGDWGFDQQVLDIVENGIPPCKYTYLYSRYQY